MSFTRDVKEELGGIEVKKKHCLTAAALANELFSSKKDIDKQSEFNIELDAEKTKAILSRNCCKRCFLRTAFICAGTINDPAGRYHFEITCKNAETAELIQENAAEFGPRGHIVKRKEKYVFYIKDADDISDMLNICEAHRSLMTFENKRIFKDLRNNVNRQVNCETANLKKTISAASRQREDILFLMECGEYDKLSPELKETCEARLREPDKSLAELGAMLSEPTSRSGINHRFQRIHALACERHYISEG